MRQRGPAEETLTARNTRKRSNKRSLVLAWVHPRDDVRPTPLDSVERVIGRGDECEVTLRGGLLSRRHAIVKREGPVPLIRDLNSHNGLFVNGKHVPESPLDLGDVVRLGEWIAVVTTDDAVSEPHVEITKGFLASPTLVSALDAASAAFAKGLPIVLEAELGSGKERMAQAIHERGKRAGRLVALNCAALHANVAESQLFGHVKGAFTGADRDHDGLFRAADGGTLFLDEILDLAPELQAKFLRAVEVGEVLAVGSTKPMPVDVRLIVASPSSLEDAVEAGCFRRDLWSRLRGHVVRIPPLRERRVEIPTLFAWFQRRENGHALEATAGFMEALLLHAWQYNVRDLERLTRQLSAKCGDKSTLESADLEDTFVSQKDPAAGEKPASCLARICACLEEHGGNVSATANDLGIPKTNIYRALAEAGVSPDDYRK